MRSPRNQMSSGTTLLEVLIATAIFAVGGLGVLGLVTTSMHLNQSSRNFTEANLIGQWQMDRVAVLGVDTTTCGDADGCFANGTTLAGAGPQTVTISQIGGGAAADARYQLRMRHVALSTGPEAGLTSVRVEVRWPRDRNRTGLDVGAAGFVDCYAAGASCYRIQFDSYF